MLMGLILLAIWVWMSGLTTMNSTGGYRISGVESNDKKSNDGQPSKLPEVLGFIFLITIWAVILYLAWRAL
jgi:hypothetical protein